MMLEEAYEVVEAIDEGDDEELVGELGDLLLQVVFHSQIATEQERFTITDVIARICEKMIRRHPHVFGEEKADTPGEVLRNWEAIKKSELEQKGKSGTNDQPGSMLDSVSASLPALMESFQMTTKVSRVGFDWADPKAVLDKVDEEITELRQASESESQSQKDIEEEMGDLLFVAVNAARLLGVDPESSLKGANRKFRRRFKHIEDRLRAQGRSPAESTLEEMDLLWDEAKKLEKDRLSSDIIPRRKNQS
jgi:MazG family protein